MAGKFFPYLLADYPSPSGFRELLAMTLRYADAIEIGIPFSDPVADGPVIQKASSEVLARGFRMDSAFHALRDAKGAAPFAVMSYANVILAYGRQEFYAACRESGSASVIVPDVPMEESAEWESHARESGLHWVRFVSLTTRVERLQRIATGSAGFLYLLGVTGITGTNIKTPDAIRQIAARIRECTKTPIALGFGLKSGADAAPFLNDVDAFIVGSRLIELADKGIAEVEAFYKDFRKVVQP